MFAEQGDLDYNIPLDIDVIVTGFTEDAVTNLQQEKDKMRDEKDKLCQESDLLREENNKLHQVSNIMLQLNNKLHQKNYEHGANNGAF